MAGAEGMVLFHRGAGNEEECDSDVWDDTALIEAYDAAVAPLKAKLAQHTGDPSLLEGSKKPTESAGHTSTTSKKKKSKKKKAKQAKKKQQASGWCVGDYCQAVFTEDGAIYEAKVTSIDPETDTCVVRYLGYGNEEEQSVEDLIRPDRSARKQRRSESVSQSETDSVSSASQKAGKKNKSSHHAWTASDFPGMMGQAGSRLPSQPRPFMPSPLPPPPPPPSFFSAIPSHPPFSTPHIPQPPMGGAASMPFSMMPPPPPPMPTDNVSNENEALCSMLLSWYMSGYHTGYYQGLKQGRQQDPSAAMGPSR